MISVIAWMFLFGTKTLPIQDNVLSLAGVSMCFELLFEFAIFALRKHYMYKADYIKRRY